LYISAHHVEDEKSMSGEIDGKLWLCVHCQSVSASSLTVYTLQNQLGFSFG